MAKKQQNPQPPQENVQQPQPQPEPQPPQANPPQPEQPQPQPEPPQQDSQAQLAALASKIKDEHKQVVDTYRQSLAHAKKVGELLSKARDICHTSSTPWKTWLEANTGLSRPTVNGYIKVYEGWAKIEAAENIDTIKGALDLLRAARPQQQRRQKGKGIVLPKSLLNRVSQQRGLVPDLVVAILVDLGIQVTWEDEPAAPAQPPQGNPPPAPAPAQPPTQNPAA